MPSGTTSSPGVIAASVMTGRKIDVTVDFGAGATGTINLEMQMPSGNWMALEGITADYFKTYEGQSGGATLRLNVASLSGGSIEWVMANA